jgi:predicted unusual protein kinase regulating ubiquinone biosynthesis (AarF/ABC1/UbiB family)
MIENKIHLTDRFKRYGQVTTSLGSTVARLLGERFLGLEINHDVQAQLLAHALGDLKGPVMKVAQFLATVPDAVPEEYARAFLHLQSQAPPMGWLFVKRRMRAELGENWLQKFADFEQTASAAASLGQVHKARSLDGTLLACKLQYPNMAATVEADLNQLKVFLKIYDSTFKALSTEEIFIEIAERLREEVDYELEAAHMVLYQEIFKEDPAVHIPQVWTELSTKRLLTMSWLAGAPLKEMIHESQAFRNQVAADLFRAWYKPFYHYGLIHGDPHLGNYSFCADGSINLLDFGCIRKFRGQFIAGVIQLYHAFLYHQPEQAVAAYEKWGFRHLSKEMIDVLNLWAHMLYEPLLEDRVRPIQPENRGLKGRAMAEKVHQELRRLGGVKPPREFVFMDRAAVGIGSVFMHLCAEQNWHQLFQEIIQDFDADTVDQRQNQLLQTVKPKTI